MKNIKLLYISTIICLISAPVFAQNADIYDTSNYNPSAAYGNIVIDDSQIASDVKQAIAANPTVSYLPVKVSSLQGVVSLNGNVTTTQDAKRLVQLVQSVRGVHDVDASGLNVQIEKLLSDPVITAKVEGLFAREKLFGGSTVPNRINVKTINGIVYLSGVAASQGQADNAEALAETVGGVKGVRSSISYAH